MDGVLLDTEPLYTQVSQAIVSRYGKTYDWSVKGNMIGRPAIDSARYLMQALDLPMRAEDYLAERETILRTLFPAAGPIPGADVFTRKLHRCGIPMAVATSTHRDLFGCKTERHREWFSIFLAVICGDDPRVKKGKPAPDIFLAAAEALGADPATCVVFEDSPAGVEGAVAAGMQVVALPDPNMDRARYSDADFIIGSYDECSLADLGLEVQMERMKA